MEFLLLAVGTIIVFTFTFGFLFSRFLIVKNDYLRFYTAIFALFYVEKLMSLIGDATGFARGSPMLIGAETLGVLAELAIYLLIALFIRDRFGVINFGQLAIIAILLLVPMTLRAVLKADSPAIDPRAANLLRNVGSIPLLAYILFIGARARRGIVNRELKSVFTSLVFILASMSGIILLDGLLESFFSIDLPKDPFIVVAYCVCTFFYLHYLQGYIRGAEEPVPEAFAERFGISKREAEIIVLLVKGYSYKSIGESLFISGATVKTHVHNIYVKTGSSGRYTLLQLLKQA